MYKLYNCMNREQAISTDESMRRYSESQQLRGLFAELGKTLLLHRPADPLQYLIDYIQHRNNLAHKVCLVGYDHDSRHRVATALQTKYDFALVDVDGLFGQDMHVLSDETVHKKVMDSLGKVDKLKKGIIISGYPNNLRQADLLHKSGTLPQRYFLMEQNEKYASKQAELIVKRNKLERKELLEILGDLVDILPSDPHEASQRVIDALGVRERKVVPHESLRLLVVHPPFLTPKAVPLLCGKYALHHVTVEKQFTRAQQKQSFKEYVAAHVRQHKRISNELQLALLETGCKSAAAKNKGYLLSGWPNNKSVVPLLKQHCLNPHLIFIFTSIRDKAIEEFRKLDSTDPTIFTVMEKPTVAEYQGLLTEYEALVDELKKKENSQIIPYEEAPQQVYLTFQTMIRIPAIYR